MIGGIIAAPDPPWPDARIERVQSLGRFGSRRGAWHRQNLTVPWSRRVCAHGLKASDVTRKALVGTCAAHLTVRYWNCPSPRLKGVDMGTVAPLPNPHTHPHTQRAILLTTLVGAGLVIAAGVVLLAGQWDSLSLVVRVTIATFATGVLATCAAVTATRAPGFRALRQPAEPGTREGRRRLTAVFFSATAVLAIFTILQFPTEPANNVDNFTGQMMAPPYWTVTAAFAVGLLIAALSAWVAPGALSTVTVWVASCATLTALVDRALWDTNPGLARGGLWQSVALTALGIVGSLLLYRWLRPPVLTIALGVGTWFIAAVNAAMTGSQFDDAPLDVEAEVRTLADQSLAFGKVALAVLIAIGVLQFMRAKEWPWPAGAVAALVTLTLVMTSHTLGVALSLLITGLLLVASSGAIALVLRHRQPEPH